jgi:pyridoxamine 5'-phosphate oxidase
MNQKNSLGLDSCFLDTNDPIELFKTWMNKAEETEPNDPNALSLATSDKKGFPSVRMVLLKDFSKNGFIFYTNLNSQKSLSLKENPKAEMCFYWKSLLRQIRISGHISQVSDKDADEYYNTRPYGARIGAWASKQSTVLQSRDELINSINKYKKKNIMMKKMFQDQIIGLVGSYCQKKLNFGYMLIIEFMSDLNILKITMVIGISFY